MDPKTVQDWVIAGLENVPLSVETEIINDIAACKS
jgi:hypothetical protein